MADDFGDKTEDPTPRKRQEAREQGKVARSRDLGTAVLIIGSMVLMKNFGPGVVGSLRTLVEEMLGAASMADASASSALSSTSRSVIGTSLALAPLLIGLVLIAVVVDVLQVGLVLNGKRLMPNLGALNPVKGFGKLFGKDRSPMQAAIVLAKLMLVSLVAYSAIHGRLLQIVKAQEMEFIQIFGLGADVVYSIGLRIGIVLLVLAILDYAFQRHRIEQELKMTKQEVKDEMRRMDGDPKIKARRKQLAQQMMREQLKRDVPTADVIVTNPTHFAVALKYDAASMHAPRVVAKGQDFMALRIREIAVGAGIPILERAPLARALYKLVNVGQEIPEQYYAAVAEILAYVYELSGKARKLAAASV
jgi:flagellar biosynthesis protein FlhB